MENLTAYHNRLLYHARLLTKDHQQADDLLQDTYLRALTHKDQYTPGTNMYAWLYSIMYTTFINTTRKPRVKNPHIEIEHYKALVDPDAYSKLEYKEVKKTLKKFKLNEELMLFSRGYTYDEISKMFNIPEGTVKTRIFNTRKKLIKAHRHS